MCRELHSAASRKPANLQLTPAPTIIYKDELLWFASCTYAHACFLSGRRTECTLQTQPSQPEVAIQKPKHTMLPLLVALFIISYGILTMLVVEQGRTIQSQRGLIMDLFNDSNELIHLKGKLAQQQQHAAGKPNGKAHAPAVTAPKNQTEAQAAPQPGNKTHGKVSDSASVGQKPAQTQKPPKPQDDDPDMRRMNISI